jgi:phosphohistidine phosphatase SixA
MIIAVAIAAMAASPPVPAQPTIMASPPPAEMLKMLQKGGYVIYFRHAKTEMSQADQDHADLSDCATQRNLNDEGRATARLIGEAFRARNIQVDRVLSSPYCRTRQTAELAFGDYEVADGLRYLSGATPEQKPAIEEATRALLGQTPAAGKNRVLISHTSNLKEAAGIWPRESGVAVIFKPTGDGGAEPVGKIEPEDWARIK